MNVCKLIIDCLDDKNPSDNNGDTPLHAAAGVAISKFKVKPGNYLEVCNLIIENGVAKNPSNNRGETPLSYATYRGNKKICELFKKRRKLGLNTIQKSKVAKK